MRQVTFVVLSALALGGFWGGRAFGTPFEPSVVPDQVGVIGHLDVDALRKTQIFDAVGGQAAIDAALDDAPSNIRPFARTLVRTARGVSFWRDRDHGAVVLATRDGHALGQLLRKMPGKQSGTVEGLPVFTVGDDDDDDDDHGYAAAFGEMLVLADSMDSLQRSIRVLGGKAPSLAGSKKLPRSSRSGVFVFVAIGDDLLSAIQKSARAKMLQLSIRSLVIDVGESAGTLTANARAEMKSTESVDKARSILEGLRAMASFADDDKARMLLDGVTITGSGQTLEVTARVPVSEIAKVIKNHH